MQVASGLTTVAPDQRVAGRNARGRSDLPEEELASAPLYRHRQLERKRQAEVGRRKNAYSTPIRRAGAAQASTAAPARAAMGKEGGSASVRRTHSPHVSGTRSPEPRLPARSLRYRLHPSPGTVRLSMCRLPAPPRPIKGLTGKVVVFDRGRLYSLVAWGVLIKRTCTECAPPPPSAVSLDGRTHTPPHTPVRVRGDFKKCSARRRFPHHGMGELHLQNSSFQCC